jgi:hypothetical protein
MRYEFRRDDPDTNVWNDGKVVHRLARFNGQHYLMFCDASIDVDVLFEKDGNVEAINPGPAVTCLECIAVCGHP